MISEKLNLESKKTSITNKTERKKVEYLTFGSPIMDLIVYVDKEFTKKHDLKLDTTSHGDRDSRLFHDIEKMNPRISMGGCSYNAIRVFNWMINNTEEQGKVACLGAIGKDILGNEYVEGLLKENIQPYLEVIESDVTAKCATIIEGRERCHITDLGASTKISYEYVEQHWEKLKDLKLVYTELYILCHQRSVLKDFAKLCLDKNKLFGFNFPSIGFLNAFDNEIKEMIEYGDIIFANKEEANHFVCNVLNVGCADVSELAEILVKLPKKNKNKSRVFVVTCGPEPAYVAVYNHANNTMEFSSSYLPLMVSKDKIVDTNGAGDSFAGAFLAYYIKGHSIENCVRAGHWAASQIIQRNGFELNINDSVPNDFEELFKLNSTGNYSSNNSSSQARVNGLEMKDTETNEIMSS